MRILNGQEIAGFIKERQAKAVRGLRQAHHIAPHLAIVRTNPSPVVDSYMKLKKAYGEDILVDVSVRQSSQIDAPALIAGLNADKTVHGIIVQLPLPDPSETDELLNLVSLPKDVDGLHEGSWADPPTATAINWLLAGYNIDLNAKKIVIVGQGRLVGKPLARMWVNSGYQVQTADEHTSDLPGLVRSADVVVSAAGAPGIIKSEMLKVGAVVVDAGVSTDNNKLVGDVAEDVRERQDLTITPVKGGVGPLTVCALFENVIQAARKS